MKNKLKEVRKNRGISQAELVKLAGISRATISKIENNDNDVNVNTKTIAKLAEVLGVKPSDIFCFD